MIKMLVIDKVRPKQLVTQSLNGNSNQSNKTGKFCGVIITAAKLLSTIYVNQTRTKTGSVKSPFVIR
nr:hypothetical protein AKG93_24765 [Vibrio harveyi]